LDKTKKSLEASFKYLVISSVATVMMLSAVAILFMAAGSTDFVKVAQMYKEYGANPLVVVASVFFIVGLFIKGGVMPFHGWLPDAYRRLQIRLRCFWPV
jgi:NADH:ubiquinone oxidoreductase subunit 2 (subunit N)